MNFEEMQFTALLIVLVIAVIIAAITLILSFAKDNRICCLGGGLALGLLSAALGFLAWTAIQQTSDVFQQMFTVISVIILILITAFVSIFTLLATIKKKEFCCLGGGIAFTGIGLGIGLILSNIGQLSNDINEVLLFLLTILFLVVLIVAILVIVISLKKCQGLCCFSGVLAIAGVAFGIISSVTLEENTNIIGLLSLINPIVLLGVLGVMLYFIKNSKK
ncbi:hypothetical protein WAK64_19830 [Bacillus spongiae]|uniref:DUF4203 domain-containing protein n=1 Tax=Bacillus spongiae TaxID=2683610 RepID=A0ABU8HIS2_9BACI